jgi:hypothetical protein
LRQWSRPSPHACADRSIPRDESNDPTDAVGVDGLYAVCVSRLDRSDGNCQPVGTIGLYGAIGSPPRQLLFAMPRIIALKVLDRVCPEGALVEPRGIEPLTSAVRLQRSPI